MYAFKSTPSPLFSGLGVDLNASHLLTFLTQTPIHPFFGSTGTKAWWGGRPAHYTSDKKDFPVRKEEW